MKKFGFTLAEVLTTLTVIGVVSALTLPNLVNNANTTAQIGPKLAKAASAFEQANQNLMNNNFVEKLSETDYFSSNESYITELKKYLKITTSTASTFTTKDGTLFTIVDVFKVPTNPKDAAYSQYIGDLEIDLNGSNNPNTAGSDIFSFTIWNDGSLRPKGGTNWDGKDSEDTHWTKLCPVNAIPTDYSSCAGHIFENNMKALYK